MFDRSKLESLGDVSVTRIGDTLPHGFPQTEFNTFSSQRLYRCNWIDFTTWNYMFQVLSRYVPLRKQISLLSLVCLPGDFVTNVKQINSQSDLISMLSFAAHLIWQSDPLKFRKTLVTRYNLPNHKVSNQFKSYNSFGIYLPLWTSYVVAVHDDIGNWSTLFQEEKAPEY